MRKLVIRKKYLVFVLYLLGLFFPALLKKQIATCQEVATFFAILAPIFFYSKKTIHDTDRKLLFVGYLFIIFNIIEIIYSAVKYGQSLGAILYESGEIFSLILFIWYCQRLRIKSDTGIVVIINKFFHAVTIILYINVFLKLLFNLELLYTGYYSSRNGGIRIIVFTEIIFLGTLLEFAIYLHRKNLNIKRNPINIAFLLAGIIYILFISQTRMQIVTLIVSMVGMFTIGARKLSKKSMGLMLIFSAALLISQSPSFQKYFNNNFATIFNSSDMNANIRIMAIRHYLEQVNKSKMLGMGYINENAVSNNLYDLQFIKHGPGGFVYWIDDVGIVGYYFTYGITGLVLLIFMYIVMLIKAVKNRCQYSYKIGIVIYMIVSGISFSFFTIGCQAYLPLIYFLIEINPDLSCFYSKKTNNKVFRFSNE